MAKEEIREFVGEVVSVHEDLKSFRMEWQNDGRTHGAHLLIENLRLQDRVWLERGRTVQWRSGYAEVEGVKTYISKSRLDYSGRPQIIPEAESSPASL